MHLPSFENSTEHNQNENSYKELNLICRKKGKSATVNEIKSEGC